MLPGAETLPARHRVLKVVISHPLRTWTDALEQLLAARWDVEVITAHTEPTWVRHAVLTHQADILITHVSRTERELGTTLEELFAGVPDLGVVAISDAVDAGSLVAAVRAGVRGWVPPTVTAEHLLAVLHGVARGETWLPPALATLVLESLLDDREARGQRNEVLARLSGREQEVLACLVAGLSRREIADRMTLSPHTVRTHINNVLHKLDVHSVLAAVSLVRQLEAGEPTAAG